MKKLYILLAAVILFSSFAKAQTIYSDDFTAGSTGWTLGSAGNGDAWIVNNIYVCSITVPNNGGGNYMHIFKGGGDSCATAHGDFGDNICYATMNAGVSTINFTSVSITFSWLCNGKGFAFYYNGFVEFSVDSAKTWTRITNPIGVYNGHSTWTSTTISSANYPTMLNKTDLRIRFGFENRGASPDPAFSVDNFVISGVGGVTCSNTGGSAAGPVSPICSGNTSSVKITGAKGAMKFQQSADGINGWADVTTGTSDTTAGSYTTPTLTSTTFYRAVLSQSSCPDQYSTVDTVIVKQNVTPSVTIKATPGDTICNGTTVTFSPTPENGGTNPVYHWYDKAQSFMGNTYSDNSFITGEIIYCTITSNALCLTKSVATSNQITMKVIPTITPSVTIISDPPGIICSGRNVTFTASTLNGGKNATYQWNINGVAKTTGNTFSTFNLVNNDVVSVTMAADTECVVAPTAKDSITVTVTICTGTTELTENDNFIITPNPSDGIFSISSTYKISSIQIFDIQGRVLMELLPANKTTFNIDMGIKAPGVYFVKANSSGGVINRKLIIQN